MPHYLVFLLDVDNTLLDNDHMIGALSQRLQQECGRVSADRYWTYFEQLRGELGYADYLGALRRVVQRERIRFQRRAGSAHGWHPYPSAAQRGLGGRLAQGLCSATRDGDHDAMETA